MRCTDIGTSQKIAISKDFQKIFFTKHMKSLLYMFYSSMELVRFGEGVCQVFDRCLTGAWQVFGRRLARVLQVFDMCLTGV